MSDSKQLTARGCPQLPQEIWTMIMGNLPLEDCSDTWLNCRPVSRMLKSVTERVFVKKHIPELVVMLHDGITTKDWRFQFVFKRVSDDPERVEMSLKTAAFMGHVPEGAVMNEWEENAGDKLGAAFQAITSNESDARVPSDMPPGLMPIVAPNHVIALRGMSRDTELPGVEFDLERMGLSFKWKDMLTLFFGEWNYTLTLLDEPLSTPYRWPGEEDLPRDIFRQRNLASRRAFRQVWRECRVRHTRLVRWERRHDVSTPFSQQPPKVLEKAYVRGYQGLVYSQSLLRQDQVLVVDEAGPNEEDEEDRTSEDDSDESSDSYGEDDG